MAILFVLLGLFMKLYLFPFVYYLGELYRNMSWISIYCFSIIPFLLLLLILPHLFHLFIWKGVACYYMIIMFSLLYTLLWASFYSICQQQIRCFLGYSGVIHSCLVYSLFVNNDTLGIQYAMFYYWFYSINLSILFLCLSGILYLSMFGCRFSTNISYYMFEEYREGFIGVRRINLLFFVVIFLLVCNLFGFPPFFGFFQKLVIVSEFLLVMSSLFLVFIFIFVFFIVISYNIRMCLKGLFWKNNYDMILVTGRFFSLYLVWFGLHLVLGGYGYLYGAILTSGC